MTRRNFKLDLRGRWTMILGKVSELWRYPVSGLRGESLQDATITVRGIAGDHLFVLQNKESKRILSPSTNTFSWGETTGTANILDLRAALEGDPKGVDDTMIELPRGQVFSSRDPLLSKKLSSALGLPVELVRYPRILETRVRAGRTLHLLTNASLARMRSFYPEGDFESIRFRPNIVVRVKEGKNGFVEEDWVGKTIGVGKRVRLRVTKPNTRCKVTTMKQGELPEDEMILRTIENRNGNRLGVMCTVEEEGKLSVGDALRWKP
jgi:uncharacterized protein YcbX